jgi:CubicO group peptidase (beta-lactamase class C family)
MKIEIMTLLTAFIIFTVVKVNSQNNEIKHKLEKLPDFVNKMMKEWKVPGVAVAVVKGSEIIYQKGFGYRDIEKQLPVTPETLFAIGSSTKPFTSFALNMLVDEGKLDLDEPVSNYIKNFRLSDEIASRHTTLRDILCHRTGMSSYDIFAYFPPESRPKIFNNLKYLHPVTGFREGLKYSNVMYVAAGSILEHFEQCKWEESVSERIFKPLGMTSSNFSVTDMQKSDDFALPYHEADGQIIEIQFRNVDILGPGGSINSNLEDMSKWLMLQLEEGKAGDKQIISSERLKQMHSPHMVVNEKWEPVLGILFPNSSYGLGWTISQYRDRQIIFHGGNIDGFSAQVSFLPQDNLGIVVLTNKMMCMLTEVITYHIYDLLSGFDEFDYNSLFKERFTKAIGKCFSGGEKEPDNKQKSEPSLPLKSYSGVYEHPAFGKFEIFLENDNLKAVFSEEVLELRHSDKDIFQISTTIIAGTLLKFHVGKDESLESFSVQFEARVPDFVFNRVQY